MVHRVRHFRRPFVWGAPLLSILCLLAACQPGSVTEENPPPPSETPQGPLLSNAPTGFTRFYENSFSSLPGSGTNLLGATSRLYRGGDINMTLKSDASAPQSPGSTLQTRWPAGMTGGSGPGSFWFWNKLGDGQGTRYREIYLSFRAKIPTADFENHSVYTKLIYFAHGNDAWTNQDVIALKGNGVNGAKMTAMTVVFSHSQADDRTGQGSGIPRYQNVDTRPLFTAGKWHHVEVYANVGTVNNYNGVVKVWVDGVLVTHRTDLKFLDSRYSFTQGFFEAQWTPVWGGTGGVKTRNDYMLLDHLYLSGRQ